MNSFPTQKLLTFAVSVLVLFTAGFLARPLLGYQAAEEVLLPSSNPELGKGVVSQVFHEFRSSFADIMFLKTEEYIHDGVGLRRLEKDEHAESAPDAHDHGDHSEDISHPDEQEDVSQVGLGNGEDHKHGANLIPDKADDFRGILGSIERQTQPYSLEHRITKNPEELLPWLRLAIISNPHHIRAIRAASFFLDSYLKQVPSAILLIEQGLIVNKDNPQLLVALGRLKFWKSNDPASALKILTRVADLWERRDQTKWSEEDELSAQSSYLIAAYCCKAKGSIGEAMRWCTRGLKQFPDNRAISKYLVKLQSAEW